MKPAAALAALLLPAVACAAPLELKGMRPGMTKDELAAARPEIVARCFQNSTTGGLELCRYVGAAATGELDTFAGAFVQSWTASLSGGRVVSVAILLHSNFFDRVADAMVERFGKPARRDGATQNRLGARFDQAELTWRRDGHVLQITKRAGSVDDTIVTLSDPKAEHERAAPKRNAADL